MIMLARSQFLPFDAHHVKELSSADAAVSRTCPRRISGYWYRRQAEVRCGVSASASRLPFYRWGFLRLCFGS